MKNHLIISIIIIFFSFSFSGMAQIKYASYFTSPSIPKIITEKLYKDNLIIIDYENLKKDRESLVAIKKNNPQIKLLIYFNDMEVWTKDIPDRPIANAFKSKLPAEYRLKRADGKPVIFWQGMEMMNESSDCPKINGQNYVEFYANWLISNILNDPIIDGCFKDNGTPTISWVDATIDANNDKKADSPSALNASWREGITELLKIIREKKGENFIIVTNKGEKHFFFLNDGVMFEKFPNNYLGSKRADGWYQCIENAKRAGPYTIFQVDLKNLEFGLASSLLLNNVYIIAGQNMQIPDKYRIETGKPLGEMYKNGDLYCRDYELIRVEVDPEKKIGKLIEKK